MSIKTASRRVAPYDLAREGYNIALTVNARVLKQQKFPRLVTQEMFEKLAGYLQDAMDFDAS